MQSEFGHRVWCISPGLRLHRFVAGRSTPPSREIAGAGRGRIYRWDSASGRTAAACFTVGGSACSIHACGARGTFFTDSGHVRFDDHDDRGGIGLAKFAAAYAGPIFGVSIRSSSVGAPRGLIEPEKNGSRSGKNTEASDGCSSMRDSAPWATGGIMVFGAKQARARDAGFDSALHPTDIIAVQLTWPATCIGRDTHVCRDSRNSKTRRNRRRFDGILGSIRL